jgi:Amt family ammonium transporter
MTDNIMAWTDGLTDPYDVCISDLGAEASQENMMRCISASLLQQITTDSVRNAGVEEGVNTLFLMVGAALVFFMQAGFAMLCAGSVRLKNVQNTMLKNLLDACGAAVSFYTVGYAFAFGGQNAEEGKSFIGHTNFFMRDLPSSIDPGADSVASYSFWFFQFAFAATSATIVAGTLAERCQMAAYLCYSVLLCGFVYPVIVHAIWSENGFLSASAGEPLWGSGMIDFAGSGVVHTTGGTTALIATIILGSRKGRFYDSRGHKLDVPKPFPGHSVALQVCARPARRSRAIILLIMTRS